ncbi:Chitin synthase, class 5 [Entophlyctis luteolus]|nr:Chitin synthase, class 5 [Entophlyctis luteolus]
MSELFDDPYAVLGVGRAASEDEIKKAYKRSALRHHPDKCPPEQKADAEIKFRAISEAYEILKDPEMRQRFDAFGMSGLRGGQQQQQTAQPGFGGGPRFQHGMFFHDPRSIFEQFFGHHDPFSDPFFANSFPHDPFAMHQRHNRTYQQHQQHQQQQQHSHPQFNNHPFFSPFPEMPPMFPMHPMMAGQGFGFNGGSFSSVSSSSSMGGFGANGNFSSQSTQTKIVNGERTTITTISDQNGTRTETVVIGRDGREKKREIVENGRVVQSVEGGVDKAAMLGDDLGQPPRPVSQSQFTEVVAQEFTVGKVDAGIAILLSPDHHLIEFPSTILPDGVGTGSIINVTIERNHDEERRKREEFMRLQDKILAQFSKEPEMPSISLKSVTQTSAIIGWKPLALNSTELKGIDVYRNNQKISLPVPLTATSAKLSGLDMSHDYEVFIVLRTSAGRYESNRIKFTTHSLDNLTGINVSFGHLSNPNEAAYLVQLLRRIGAKYTEELSTDNTHLICTFGSGPKYEKAQEWNIPCVSPEFLKACENNGRIMPSHSYYVGSGAW